jgi:hypothetical protein
VLSTKVYIYGGQALAIEIVLYVQHDLCGLQNLTRVRKERERKREGQRQRVTDREREREARMGHPLAT